MPQAPDGKEFVVKSAEGRVEGAARDILDLHWIILGMAPEGLRFHIRPDGNDIACWVRDVLGERSLAESLESLGERDHEPRQLKARVLELLEDWMV